MKCADCSHWITVRKTAYDDGSEIINWRSALDDKGSCSCLGIETTSFFGCLHFKEGHDHAVIDRKSGAPWQNWRMDTCPDCGGHPGDHSGAKCRCAGTGQVRWYDDGFVGDELTRLHPKEKPVTPVCLECKSPLKDGWRACPMCGFKVDGIVEVEHVGGGNGGVIGRM